MATARKRPRIQKVLDISNLKLDDVMCPICRSIIIEPVTLPCKHSLCFICFDKTIENNTLTCPVCRKRIGGWLRTATRNKSIINLDFWGAIQEQFQHEVKCKQAGEDDGVEENVVGNVVIANISEQGEIGQEFKEQLQKFSAKQKEEQEKLDKASLALAKLLMEEEMRAEAERKRQKELDEEFAKSLLVNTSAGESHGETSSIDTVMRETLQPAITSKDKRNSPSCFDGDESTSINNDQSPTINEDHQCAKTSGSSDGSRCNSIDGEITHFKPIKIDRDTKRNVDSSMTSDTVWRHEFVPSRRPKTSAASAALKTPPQGPRRLHVTKRTAAASKAFSRVGNAQDGAGSDTDFEEEEEKEDGEENVKRDELSELVSSDVVQVRLCQVPSSDQKDITLAETIKNSLDSSLMIGEWTSPDVQRKYREMEKQVMDRIRQEEEDRKLALQMQESWERDERQRTSKVTSDYKLRRKDAQETPKTLDKRQTTLDKHLKQVRL